MRLISLISLTDVAVHSRDRSRKGAPLTCGGEAVPRERAVAALRPQRTIAAFHFGSGATEARQVECTWQQVTSKQYAHMTRIATADGGALGPHPARDPV